MSRAGRWQASEGDFPLRQGEFDVPPEATFGLGAVEEDVTDRRMSGEESGQVVGDQCVVLDSRIEAALAAAGIQHVPYGNAGPAQLGFPCLIIQLRRKAQHFAHERPERIARVRVILVGGERGQPRHAAEDQDAGIGCAQRRKTAGVVVGHFFGCNE